MDCRLLGLLRFAMLLVARIHSWQRNNTTNLLIASILQNDSHRHNFVQQTDYGERRAPNGCDTACPRTSGRHASWSRSIGADKNQVSGMRHYVTAERPEVVPLPPHLVRTLDVLLRSFEIVTEKRELLNK